MKTATSVHPGLARSLADCGVESASGIATALRGKLKRLFCVEEGDLIYAASNIVEEQFSEVLIEKELVSVAELARARQESEGRGVKLSRWLVDEQIIDEATLRSALEEHVRRLLFITLDWPDGESSLERGRPDLAGELPTRLPCVPLILDYARQFPVSLDEVRGRIGPLSGSLTRCDERADSLARFGLADTMSFVLGRCDGTVPVQELISTAPGGEESSLRAIHGLMLLGAVEMSSKPGVVADSALRSEILARLARAELADAYGVLDVPATASRKTIRDAYYLLARNYHPDRFRTGELTDLLPRIEVYFARVTESYNTLHDPDLRAEYDRQRAEQVYAEPQQDTRYLAEENFRLAKALINKGRLRDAVTSLENAIQLQGRNATYRLELGRLLARNPLMRQEAEQQLIECTRLDPSLADAYFVLGEIYLKQGREEDARNLFRETRRWDASHQGAAERLAEIGAG